MTTQAIVAIVQFIIGLVLSLLLEIIPGVKEKWTAWKYKALTLFLLFLAVSIVWWVLGCFANIKWGSHDLGCDTNGALQAIALGFLGFMSTQTAYGVASRKLPNAVARNW